jgi:plasmid maintenance system killer protein
VRADALGLRKQASAVSRFRNIERVARRKLLQIHAATELGSLRVPPGKQLEALKADRKGQHSLRINDQWRSCFSLEDRRRAPHRDRGLPLGL